MESEGCDGRWDPKSDTVMVKHYISVVAHRVEMLRKRVEDTGQPPYASTSAAALSEVLVRMLSRLHVARHFHSQKTHMLQIKPLNTQEMIMQ